MNSKTTRKLRVCKTVDNNLLFHKRKNKLQNYNEIRLVDSSMDKTLLYKDADWHSNPQDPWKSQGGMMVACNPSTHERETGDPWAKLASPTSQN